MVGSAKKGVANRRQGLTLIELLVVVALIAVLVLLLLPAVQSARESARRVTCANQMRQLALALDRHQVSLNCYPPSCITADNRDISFVALVLPYFEQDAMFRLVDFSQVFGGATAILSTVPGIRCPSAPPTQPLHVGSRGGSPPVIVESPGANHYLGVMGASDGCPKPAASAYDMLPFSCLDGTGGRALTGILYPDSATRAGAIRDGTSMTFLLGEFTAPVHTRPWVAGGGGGFQYSAKNMRWPLNTAPAAILNNDFSFSSPHPGGVTFANADGSVRFFEETTDLAVLKALATRARASSEAVVSVQ